MMTYAWNEEYVAAVLETDDHLLREKFARLEASLPARLAELDAQQEDEEYGRIVRAIAALKITKAERLPLG